VSETRDVALLIWMDGEEIRGRWPLDKPVATIGRWPDNDVVVDDRWVSRHHAQVRREGNQYMLEDRGSKNGTLVNGKRIVGPVALQDGDEVQVAPLFTLTFVDYGATAPLPGEQRPSGLEIDPEARQVWIGGQLLSPPLSLAQFALVELLAQEPGRVYSRDEIVAVVWAEDAAEGVSDEAIDALVRRVRLRFRELESDHEYIVTVRGYGFKLTEG
jgi:DNA-binding response OmpR family regulator